MNTNFIKPDDMVLAYRKVKVDVFYSGHYSAESIIDYENNLKNNLEQLRLKLLTCPDDLIKNKKFVGGYHFIPKTIKTEENSSLSNSTKCVHAHKTIHFTDPKQNWESQKDQKAVFRLIADVSWDFLVLSELWIMKVGHLFDEKLSNQAYGNRIRRKSDNTINPYSLGTFKPYLKPYKDWKKDALKSIDIALKKGIDVLAITGDISNFYPSLNPIFLLNKEFQKSIDVCLDVDQEELNRIFVQAIIEWNNILPKKYRKNIGLPVGVPASSLIANVALFEFDQTILNNLCPIHFGRYVDDILLVLDNTAHRKDDQEIWNYISSFFYGKLKYDGQTVSFSPSYLADSNIQFKNEKNKIFVLTGSSGKNYIKSIQQQINKRSSEWRAMPDIPNDPESVSADIAFVVEEGGEAADNLRCAEKFTIRRSEFAIKLRDFESLSRDLHHDSWKEIRYAFLLACLENIFVLPHFFEFVLYVPRIIQLAISCQDFDFAAKFIEKIGRIETDIERISNPHEFQKWKYFFKAKLFESIIAAFPFTVGNDGKKRWQESYLAISSTFTTEFLSKTTKTIELKNFIQRSKIYFYHDLGRYPFRHSFFNFAKNMLLPKIELQKQCVQTNSFIPSKIMHGIVLLPIKEWWTKKCPCGIPFATRPLNLIELYLLYSDLTNNKNMEAIDKVLLAIRGFTPAKNMPFFDKNILRIGNESQKISKINISLACWHTNPQSSIAAVKNMVDPDTKRYFRFSKLIDDILQTYPTPMYFVMPELSVPSQWFCLAALRLARKNISFIAGIEYIHLNKNKICNQVWAALRHDSLGFPSSMLYRQSKQLPALSEKKELRRLDNCELFSQGDWSIPPILNHNNLFFSILICSELTNIAYRSALRGNIDILFVPAWNRDLETFNALVESSALDIHAYIVECNDQAYGDSRVRGPFKKSWQRDIARLKGGNNDYFVNVSLDIEILRRFQSSCDSPSAPFKPVPDGFKLNYLRKALPLEEKQND